MEDLEFLRLIYREFRETGHWPGVRALQIKLRKHGNAKLIAARIGWQRVGFEDRDDGVCFLRLDGLDATGEAGDDIAAFLAVIRGLAQHCTANGLVPVGTAGDIGNTSVGEHR